MVVEQLPYADVIRHAVRRARLLGDLEQAQVARRMANLGYSWHPQTVSNVENGKRRVTAEELLGLSLALETSIAYLLTPLRDGARAPEAVTTPSGGVVLPSALYGAVGDGRPQRWAVRWEDDSPVWPDAETLEELAKLDQRLAADQVDVDELLRTVKQIQEETAAESPERRQLLDEFTAEATQRSDTRSAVARRLRELREGLSTPRRDQE